MIYSQKLSQLAEPPLQLCKTPWHRGKHGLAKSVRGGEGITLGWLLVGGRCERIGGKGGRRHAMFVHPPFLGLTCSYNMGEQKRNNKCSPLPPLSGTGLMPAQSLDNFGAAPSEGSCRRNWRKKADGTAGIFLSAIVRFGQECV